MAGLYFYKHCYTISSTVFLAVFKIRSLQTALGVNFVDGIYALLMTEFPASVLYHTAPINIFRRLHSYENHPGKGTSRHRHIRKVPFSLIPELYRHRVSNELQSFPPRSYMFLIFLRTFPADFDYNC